MAKMNPSKLRNVLAELPCCDLSGTKKEAIDTIITKYLAGDIVSVVRCKDCKHYYVRTTFCDKLYSWGLIKMTEPEDFCSYGERIDGDPE